MKILGKVLFLILLGTAYFLSSCNSSPPSDSNQSQQGTVTIAISFPEASSSEVVATGVPQGASEAYVAVTDSDGNVLAEINLTPDSSSQQATLPTGVELTFTTSVKDSDGNEIAWGQQQATVTDGDVVTLAVSAIISGFWISNYPDSLYFNVKTSIGVVAHTPNNYYAGPLDYTISCTATGATCSAGTGYIEVTPDGTSNTVDLTISVTGLGADHSQTTFTNSYTFNAVDLASQADIQITKVVDNQSVTEGDTVTFTITAANVGPVSISGVSVNDLLPAGLTFSGATADVGTYDSTTGVWDVGTLDSGAQATLQVVATVDTGTSDQTITNTATLDTTNLDPADSNSDNDSSSVSVYVDLTTGTATLSGDFSPPWCYFDSPSWNYTYSLNNTIAVSMNVYDANDSITNLVVTAALGTQTVDLTYDSTTNTFTGSFTATSEYWGNQTLTGTVTDPAGNSSSCFVNFSIGN